MSAETTFATAEECEGAFYAAFTACDVDAMMTVWAWHAPLLCIHPGGPPLTSREAIEQSWRVILDGVGDVQFTLSELQETASDDVAVRFVHENIHHGPGLRETAVVCATNVFVRENGSWRMRVHHASTGPTAPRAQAGEVH